MKIFAMGILPVVNLHMITRWTCIAGPSLSLQLWAARTMYATNYNAPPMMTGLLAAYRRALRHTTAFSSSCVISILVHAAQQLL
jgi:hypothetical protein